MPEPYRKGKQMPILLWLMGVPIMLIVVLMLFGIA
jgi:predicted nucleic acid-binding Zn ribbon protein